MAAGTSQTSQFALPKLPELRSTTVFGRKICYYDSGTGPVLVLVHGIGGDADEWAFCLEGLSSSHRVIALDLLGFGRSDKPLIQYNVEVFVEILERFLQNLGIKSASLLGGSLGGWIAAALALRSPRLVEKLVLVDAAGLIKEIHELPIDLRVSTRRHMREIMDFVFYDKRLASEVLVDLAYRQHLERGDGYTIQSVLQSLQDGAEGLDETIAVLGTPTLILWGEQDAMIPVAVAHRFHELIHGSRLEIIPECGHLPALEKPVDLVRHALNFLAQA